MEIRKYEFSLNREESKMYQDPQEAFNQDVLSRLDKHNNDYRAAFVEAMHDNPELYRLYENGADFKMYSQNSDIVNDSDETLSSRYRSNRNNHDWFEAGRRLVLVVNELMRNDQTGKLSGLEAHRRAEQARPLLSAIYNFPPR